MKKLMSFLLAAIMLVSMIPTTLAVDTHNYDQGTEVVYEAQGNESYTVTVPAKLNPGQSGTVTLKGTWAENRTITVTSESTVTLVNSILPTNTKILNVLFTGISEKGNNTTEQTFTNTVSVDPISDALFGVWSGKFNYNIETETVVKTEAYAIYDEQTQGLYFVRAASAPVAGETFAASNGQTLNVTNVYSGFETNNDYYYDWIDPDLIVLPEWHEHQKEIVYVEAIDTITPINMEGWFRDFDYCEEANLGKIDTSNVTTMKATFQAFGYSVEPTNIIPMEIITVSRDWDAEGHVVLEDAVFIYDIGVIIRGVNKWDTAKVTNMHCMFANLGGYTETWKTYVDDVSGWDVSNCMDFEGMFAATGAEPYKQNLTSWNIQEGARTSSIHYSGPNLYFASDLY